MAPLLLNAEDGQATMPVLLYNETGRSVAFAPTDHFFIAVHETVTSPDVLAMGPAGSVPSYPPGFSYTTAMVGGRAANSGGPGGLTGPLSTPFRTPGTLSGLTKTHCNPFWDPLTLASGTFG